MARIGNCEDRLVFTKHNGRLCIRMQRTQYSAPELWTVWYAVGCTDATGGRDEDFLGYPATDVGGGCYRVSDPTFRFRQVLHAHLAQRGNTVPCDSRESIIPEPRQRGRKLETMLIRLTPTNWVL